MSTALQRTSLGELGFAPLTSTSLGELVFEILLPDISGGSNIGGKYNEEERIILRVLREFLKRV